MTPLYVPSFGSSDATSMANATGSKLCGVTEISPDAAARYSLIASCDAQVLDCRAGQYRLECGYKCRGTGVAFDGADGDRGGSEPGRRNRQPYSRHGSRRLQTDCYLQRSD